MGTLIFLNLLFFGGAAYSVYSGRTAKDKTNVRGWYIAAGLLVVIIGLIDVISV